MVAPVTLILKELVAASYARIHGDEKIRDVISDVMAAMGADALVFRVGSNTLPLGAFHEYLFWSFDKKQTFVRLMADMANLWFRQQRTSYRDALTGQQFYMVFPAISSVPLGALEAEPEFFCFVAGLRQTEDGTINVRPRWKKLIEWDKDAGMMAERDREDVEAYCRALQLALLLRAEKDSIFSPEISATFWNLVDNNGNQSLQVRPWEDSGGPEARHALTASLSFDLRKSTFVLEKVIDRRRHSDWLETLVGVLKEISLARRGIFDKFTGDGVLVHFPVYAFERDLGEQAISVAVRNCVSCAWEMIHAADLSTAYMLRNLTLMHSGFGAAVGVALDDALWSLQRGGAPVTVGRGVVDACRLSEGERGTVEITNAVYRYLDPFLTYREEAEEIPFVSKEHKLGSGVVKYCFRKAPAGLPIDPVAVRNVVLRAFETVRR